jgi:hypothetical protein
VLSFRPGLDRAFFLRRLAPRLARSARRDKTTASLPVSCGLFSHVEELTQESLELSFNTPVRSRWLSFVSFVPNPGGCFIASALKSQYAGTTTCTTFAKDLPGNGESFHGEVACGRSLLATRLSGGSAMGAKRISRREWSAQDEKELRKHSKNRTPVAKISKALKRTPGALRQKARHLGFSLGHRQRPKRSSRRA